LTPRRLGGYFDPKVRTPAGKTNPISVLLFLAFVAGGWWLYTYGPIYIDNLEVKDEVAKGVAQAALEGDTAAHNTLVVRLNKTIGWHYEIDEETQLERVKPGLGVEKEQVVVSSDSSTKTVTVRVEYDRTFQLAPLKDRKTLHFVVLKQGKLQ
jgi:VCBS repeat-containing protein